MSDQRNAYDVAVIGFGPSGATLANLLGLCGLDVLVLEREATPYPLPRAVHFDDEVMRVFQTIGLGAEVAAETIVNPGMRFVDAQGTLLLDWSRPQEVGRHGWHPSYRFHQPALERALGGAIARHGNVHLRRLCEVFLLCDRGEDVLLRYEDMANGRIREATAAHVVGCDGARSLVRRFIGSEMEDLGFHERWLVVDALLKCPRPDLGDHSVQHCDPERSVTYTRQPGNRRRWEIRQRADDSTVTRPEQIWPLLSRWIAPHEAEIERFATYMFHSLVAKRWRSGRLWIAGDAAHQTPPFMGQGMCAGIRDVANLAWKLAAAVRGFADDALLDSYQSERAPNVASFISTAIQLGSLINASDPAAALAIGTPGDSGILRMESLTSRLGPGPGDGPHRGSLFAQPHMRDGRLMDDVVGYAPVLVGEASLLTRTTALPGIACVTTEDAPEASAALAEFGVRAALLRPDRYILATANNERDLQAFPAIARAAGLARSITMPAHAPTHT